MNRGKLAGSAAGPMPFWRRVRGPLIAVGLFSAVINVLMLTGAVFMLEVYDRVLPSRSVETLAGLAAIALLLYAFLGILDVLRGRLLSRIGTLLDVSLSTATFRAAVTDPLRECSTAVQRPVQDADTVRMFLGTPGPAALFDLPWLPFYLAVCFGLHPLIGWTATVGAILLVVLTILTEVLSRGPMTRGFVASGERGSILEQSKESAQALVAMGMLDRLERRFLAAHATQVRHQRDASDVTGGFAATSKTVRLVLQSAVLGVGAYLAILDEVTPGLIIAAAIVSARALAPIEGAIANWRGFVAARGAWKRLREHETAPPASLPTSLPAPSASLSVERLSVAPPGAKTLAVSDVSFKLEAGQGIGIIGPSGSGKSSLARALVGAWRPARGCVRLDGAELDQWDRERLGRHIGFLPQEFALIDGTVAENIARFDPDRTSEAVIAAAEKAGVHELVLSLPDGYDTRVGSGHTTFSTGQRQRIALARALYGDPFLVVLDEPNSALDAMGDAALGRAIAGVRERGGIVVVIAHRTGTLAHVEQALMLVGGKVAAIGPKDDVVARASRRRTAEPQLKVVEKEP